MKKPEEMFKEIGYEKIEFVNAVKFENALYDDAITFYFGEKIVHHERNKLSIGLIEAIDKQIEELKWKND